MRLGDVESGNELRRFSGHNGDVSTVAFSSKGALLASGSHDSSVRIWDAATGQQLFRLDGHAGQVTSVTFGPEGKRVLSGSTDGTLRLWDIATGEQIGRIQAHKAGVSHMYVSFRQRRSDLGLSYAVSSNLVFDDTLRWWRLEPQSHLLEWVCANRYVGSFECPEDIVLREIR
jgi:WD40 repeat protein